MKILCPNVDIRCARFTSVRLTKIMPSTIVASGQLVVGSEKHETIPHQARD